MRLKVIDVNGKIVYTTSTNARGRNNNYTLNLHSLSPGTYVLELSCNGSMDKAKFVLASK